MKASLKALTAKIPVSMELLQYAQYSAYVALVKQKVCADFLLWMIGTPVDTDSSTTVSLSITSTTAISIHSC